MYDVTVEESFGHINSWLRNIEEVFDQVLCIKLINTLDAITFAWKFQLAQILMPSALCIY